MNPTIAKAIRFAPVVYLPVFLGWYFLLEGRPAETMIPVASPLDGWIDFNAVWILAYLSWFPYLIVGIGWIYARDWRELAELPRLVFLMITGMTACLIGYTFWPTTQTLRPVEYPQQGVFTQLVVALQGFDDPSNVFPSLHVYTSIVLAFCIATSRYVARRWLKFASGGLALLIAASTCYLKQHSILDSFGAAALFLLVLGLWRQVAAKPMRGVGG